MIKKLLILLLGISFCHAQTDEVLVCDVKFKQSKFDNPHAGSAFLLNHDGVIYACTAKHVLFFAKTDGMKTVSFGDDLKSWSFITKRNKTTVVKAGRLVNEDSEELLVMPPKGDWLVFETKGKIPDNIAVYNLREAPLKKDEPLYFLGYPYGNTEPIRIAGKFLGHTKEGNLRLDVPKGSYNGCSGGPVLDSGERLVGLVSMGYFNEKENQMIFEPSSTKHFLSIITAKNNTLNRLK